VRTVAVIHNTLLDLLSDAEERMDLARSAEAAAVEVVQRQSARMVLLPRATLLGYAMTLGKTGSLSR